jgi:HlyD family secretion protein
MKRHHWMLATVTALMTVAAVSRISAPTKQGESVAQRSERFLTQDVVRGDITRSVTATGSLNPVDLVQVGTQVSGTIRTLHVDFNSRVQAGELLAQIDTATLDADLAQTQAQVRSAESAQLLAQIKLERQRALLAQGFVARSELDDAQAALESARAQLDQQRAAMARANTNRRYAEIRSPVAGTVVSREISVGQTVAASLQTPVLFKIAKDLREMQIETNIAEADVGFICEGQRVTFTVDAHPERVFEGEVRQIRNNYTVQQNVVTYTVIVRTHNDDLSLRPGMTGYVSVAVGQRRSVLRVPNAALRYAPTAGVTATADAQPGQRQLWLLGHDGVPRSVVTRLGLADSQFTELVSGPLHEGDRLIIGERPQGGFAGPRIF